MSTIELNVQEMSCGACVRHVTQALSPLPGVEAVEVDLQAGRVRVSGNPDSAALLTYRAAWQRDQGRSVTSEAAMAKLAATEGAQQVIDAAVQIFGGLGVVSGQPVERLYRDIRALRIYEGASEVQQLIIARELLKENRENRGQTTFIGTDDRGSSDRSAGR